MILFRLNKLNQCNKSAFSLIEISITILIIGLLIAGVVGSKHIIKSARLNSAKARTLSSPINSIKNNELWLETSIVSLAFNDVELSTGESITGWFDRSNNQDKPQIEVVGSGPIYSNSINSIPAILFNSSSSSNHLKISDASFLNNTDYTIMITEQRVNQNSGVNYLLGGNDSNNTFGLGYSADGAIIQTHGESSSANNTATIETTAAYSNKPRVITFTHSASLGNKIYINTTLANEDDSSNAKAHLSGIGELNIGKNYYGEIGEIAIFSRALKQVEIVEIEDYMTDKYNAPNNRDVTSSCVSGTITASGCEATCAVNINGVSTSSVADGSTTTFNCDGTGYKGTTSSSYVCSNGSLSPTPSASQCINDNGCDDFHTQSGDECLPTCAVNINGVSLTQVNGASGTLTCDELGYDATQINYTCSGGTLSPTPNNCGCDTDNGYSDNNGVCEIVQDCTIPQSLTGLSGDVLVSNGDTTYDCSTFGDNSFVGTLNFSACSNGEDIAAITNNDACYTLVDDSNAFITTWSIPSNDRTLILPTLTDGTYHQIDWGDGNGIQNVNSSSAQVTYGSAGTKTVKIYGVVAGWRFANTHVDRDDLVTITNWGQFKPTLNYVFGGANNLTSVTATDTPDLSATTNLGLFFDGCTKLTNVNNIGSWDVSNATHFVAMFRSTKFNQSLANWDMSSCDYTNAMFTNNTTFNQAFGGSWDATFRPFFIRSMFQGATAFNQNIGSWDMSRNTDMGYAFDGASSFNQNLELWDVSSLASNFGADNIFRNAGISTANYSRTLEGIANVSNNSAANGGTIPSGMKLGSNRSYVQQSGASGNAKNILQGSPNNWTITP